MNKFEIHTKRDKNTNDLFTRKTILIILLFIYLSILFYVTLFAWNHGASYGPLGPGGRNYNLVPLRSIYRIAIYSPNIADPLIILGGNVIMFFPFGLLMAAGMEKKRKAIWLVPVLSLILSSFIEINQYIFTHRVANVDDVLLNAIGGIAGAFCTLCIRWLVSKYSVRENHKMDYF
ncbi:VanZ family protein [Salibacterium aidingense]|uniref:VanZ family protein n=1 Tax=Salibacterium aidingense TaxID=384933 RepID=UPI003BED276F